MDMNKVNEEIKEIALNEINAEAIKDIRKVKNESNNAYKTLKNAIDKDGQQHPIILRELTSKEQEKSSKKGTKYGIIDGHHRYKIALEMKKEAILSKVLPLLGDEAEMDYRDTALAFRVNESNIKMSKREKGKIISDLLEKNSSKNITEIGREIFGVGKTAAYDYVAEYRDLSESENNEKLELTKKSPTETRGRKAENFNINNLMSAWEKLPKTEGEYLKEDLSFEDRIGYARAIRTLETQLRKLRKQVFNDEVKKALSEEDTSTKEK